MDQVTIGRGARVDARLQPFVDWAEKALRSYRIMLEPLGFTIRGNLDYGTFGPEAAFHFEHVWPKHPVTHMLREDGSIDTFPPIAIGKMQVVPMADWQRRRDYYEHPMWLFQICREMVMGLLESRLTHGVPQNTSPVDARVACGVEKCEMSDQPCIISG